MSDEPVDLEPDKVVRTCPECGVMLTGQAWDRLHMSEEHGYDRQESIDYGSKDMFDRQSIKQFIEEVLVDEVAAHGIKPKPYQHTFDRICKEFDVNKNNFDDILDEEEEGSPE